MALSIKNPETEKLARQVARRTGETVTAAVTQALRERLRRLEGRAKAASLADDLLEIGRQCAALPDHDTRPVVEIVEDMFETPR
ncbi:MAG: type II toxin-antitoxin system VapB family antitoxin [Alphaproteobacteria bacterium]|nr:type II toxin-antitoxin system VapB family antitoxin [Alphaproteobacteria bacterium]